jgi:hypothetical protein
VVQAAGDQWLRRPAPSDLKVIVVDIDRASIDTLGTWPWPRETMARLVEAVRCGRGLMPQPLMFAGAVRLRSYDAVFPEGHKAVVADWLLLR